MSDEHIAAPVELEHAMGYNGRYPKTLEFHPAREADIAVLPIGKLLLLSDLNDPHKQSILRGHDSEITCVAVSKSGRFICSGQAATRSKEACSPAVVWLTNKQEIFFRLDAHKGGIIACAFSHDDRWVCTTGQDGRVCVWDMDSGQLAGGSKGITGHAQGTTSVAKWVVWSSAENLNTRRPRYNLVLGYEQEVHKCAWEFDIKAMAFALTQTPCHVSPSGGGLRRLYNCGYVSDDGNYCYAGTSSGECVVYNLQTGLYRTAIPTCPNVLSCIAIAADIVIIGGADGSLKSIIGQEKQWRDHKSVRLVGGITNMALSADKEEILVGTNSGMIYRVLAQDLTYTLVKQSHTGSVKRIAFPALRSDIFASISDDGTVRQWDLSYYTLTCGFSVPAIQPTCLSYLPQDTGLVVGWTDGSLRGLDMSSATATVLWHTPNAHRGPVADVVVATDFMCSAGEDAIVRVWSHTTQERLYQIEEHRKPITGIVVDVTTDAIIHTVSRDKHVFTYDLFQSHTNKLAKRLTYHLDEKGTGLTGVTQRRNNERELIVCTADNRVLVYDIDYFQPTCQLVNPTGARVNTVCVSPSGNFLACGTSDGSLQLYDLTVQQPRILGQVQCHSNDILSVKWSPDERQLVTAGNDSAMCIWNVYAGPQASSGNEAVAGDAA
eukprot:NODE_605_length_2257_cov_149.870197_g575_i0.p1 GENE.NODE_605_length_2257_cov_149.870197_g575_i0~~NODE_605_length_2257_cov_149.870197_g575_i0.p1  ORF type:complete len:662 (-),score=116.64 NODE_605_length_2257_cov_149.870197_g575_i0:169-2154(-)